MAAIRPSDLSVLHGAGLSGQLGRKVEMEFGVERGKVVVRLDEKNNANIDTIAPGEKYG